MYYKLWVAALEDEDEVPFGYYDFIPDQDEYLEWPWLEGIKFDEVPPQDMSLTIDLDNPDSGEFADYVYGPIPLVTDRLKLVLDSCNISNIDYYPVEVLGTERFENFPKYYAFNLIGKVAASNRDKSEYLEAFGAMGATLFSHFVLNKEAVGNLDLFRLAEQLSTIVVSERIKQACEEADIDTLDFIPLEDTAM